MKIKSLALVVASIIATSGLPTTALAELELPSGSDRRPDLSLDPFERARQAVRKLPSVEDKTQENEPERERISEPEPPAEASIEERRAQHDPLEIEAPDEKGEAFSYEFAVTFDAQSVVNGGDTNPDAEGDPEKSTSGIGGVLDLAAEVDTGAADLWDDGLFFLYAILTFGAVPEATGDLHGTSGVDAGGTTMRIGELWYEHSFPHSHSSALIGWHDYNGEFYVSEFASLFVNAGFGMGQTVAEHGGPSGYPVTTLGARFKTELTETSYFQFALYDGAATDEAFNNMLEVGLDKNDGMFVGAEAGYLTGEPGDADYMKIGVGAWYLRAENGGFTTDRYDEEAPGILDDNPRPHNAGVYILADVAVGEKLGLFFKHGRARAEYNQFDQFYAAGLNYTGIIPGREDDVLGIGLVHTRQSAEYIEYHNARLQTGDLGLFVAETAIEVTYTTQITDWLMLQPDLQYIQQPGMDANMPNAVVIGIRAQAVF